MELRTFQGEDAKGLPRHAAWALAGICAAPMLARFAGVGFGASGDLAGSYLHNLLEWTAVCLATLTAVMALVHFWITRSPLTPVVGAALFWSGCMDAFHTLASDHFIPRVADAARFIPLTWTASNLFGCVVLLAGTAVVLKMKPRFEGPGARLPFYSLAAFGSASYLLARYCAASNHLPQCQFPTHVLTRPFDLIPVVLYLGVGIPLFRALGRKFPGPFSQSILLSALAHAASELYMSFGSASLYDSNFNIAHTLKIVAYAVPLTGLLLDYWRTYLRQANLVTELERTSRFLEQERQILQLVASGAPQQQVLDTLAVAVEEMAGDVMCGILLLDPERRRLLAASGPHLPKGYLARIDGLEIGASVGACGTAAYHNCAVLVEDILTDPRFDGIREILTGYGFGACWSVPIRDSRNQVLGTLAVYHRSPAHPEPRDLRTLEAGAHLAGNALERLRAEEQLRASLQRMALAEKAARFGIWEIDRAKGTLTLSDGAAALTGSPAGVRAITEQEAWDWVHPELAVAQENGEYLREFSFTMPDGARRWVRNRGRAENIGTPQERITGALIDITQQQEMLRGLELARAAAERALSIKEQFLANMSHELRTPLNGIIGMIALLSDSGVTAEQEQFIGTIRQCGETLLHLINDVLDLAKMEAGKVTLERVDFDLRKLVRETAAMLGPAASARGLELRHIEDARLPARVTGDLQRLRQVLLNLLSNAVKFTHQGHVSVDISLVEDEGSRVRVRFAVRDTGIGIAREAQSAIFEPFRQADSSTTRNYGGTGLGLSICRSLISLMGGALELDSEPGKGSEFSFTVPLEVAGPALAVADGSKAIPRSLARLRILLAEDNAINQQVAVRLLEKMGHRVDVASNGVEAVAAAQQVPYDLVLMDCQMPRMDGYEAARAIRRSHGGDEMPIVAMTANVMPEDRQHCLDAGMNAFLPKPISVESIHGLLESLSVRY